ncbi:sugar ABC transporter substrate-binding protein [Aphanothece hegewaldii CCALA 016]|uniref:Sugar ABC transporter substrate-binding protein n=1 Tax=Aphanothece hegewaldii CCALA 016 TaxID=2107694 RepID=A0A2T1M1S3_9CHRO|nr:SLBB domain-containing protein [Aphanothece hegewaldii]PSF38653.1 sugar ABC transporter substrate-binding protein [Aphanothece hegewaldii CCALA 016]
MITQNTFAAQWFSTSLLLLSLTLPLPAFAQQTVSAVSQPVEEVKRVLDPSEYTLGSGDRLRIDIFQAKDYSGEYSVVADGTVTLPLIGNTKVKGLTIAQTTNLISRKYAEYLKVPVVTVILSKPRPLKIAISGEIDRPGSYEVALKEDLQYPSVSDLMELAGGVTTTADVRQVQIRRVISGKNQVLTANLWDFIQQGNQEEDLTLQDGDSIYVPTVDQIDVTETPMLASANFGIQPVDSLNVAVVGEVYRPGTHKIEARRDTENARPELPRLSEAITQAGGIKPLADIRNVEVRRLTRTGTQQVISVNLWELLQSGDTNKDVVLQKGDTIIIPKAEKLETSEVGTLSAASFAPKTIRVNVIGEVKKPGALDVPPNTPLNNAILAAGGFDMERADHQTVDLIRLNPDGTVIKQKIRIDLSKDISDANNPVLRNEDVIVVERSRQTAASDGLQTILKPIGSFFSIFRFFGF